MQPYWTAFLIVRGQTLYSCLIKSILRHIGLKLFKTCDITQISKSDIAFIEKAREMDKTTYNNKIFPSNTFASINWATALLSFSFANLPNLLENDKLRNLLRQSSELTKNNVTPQH